MLCRIKRDHPVHIMFKMSAIGRNARLHFLTFFQNSWDFLVQILHTYCTFLSTLEYKFLSNYLRLMKLGNIKYDHPACVSTDGGRFEHINSGRA